MSLRTLVILQGYDPSGPTLRTFYLTNATPFITTPSETPASQSFDAVLSQPLDVRRRVQSLAGGSVRPTVGEVRIHNQDGAYDTWLGYAWDGRAITVRTGPESGAYPSAYPVTFTGQIDRLDVQGDEIVVRVRDALAALDAPVADTLYAGDNVPPDGLEGGEELEGRPKPLAFGVVKNVPLVQVNAAKLIYEVSDSALASISAVRDRGVTLGPYAPVDFAQTSASHGAWCGASDGTTIIVGGWNGTNPAIKTTTDGATFTTIGSLPFISAGAVVGMAYAPVLTRFCAVTNNATGEIATSDNAGATWTIRTAAAAVSFNQVRWCTRRSRFVALADGGAIHTSPTGVTWTAQTSGTAQDLFDVAVNGPLLLAVGTAGATTTSADGTTWTALTVNSTNREAAFWHDGLYYMAGATNNTLYRSENALTFTLSGTIADTTLTLTDLAAAGEWVVALMRFGNATFHVMGTRDNGVSWIATQRLGVTEQAHAIVPHADRWYVLNADIGGSTQRTYRSGAPAAYASLADLEDDALAPLPGSYKYIADSSGTYIRLGGSPDGTITADATQGAAAANRTAAELFKSVLTRAGYSSSDWVAGDLTALDTADNSELGLFIDDETTVAEALDAIAQSVGAWWGVDATGDFRIAQLTAPSGSSTFSITANDIRGRVERLASSDPLLGLPSFRTSLRYALADSLTLDGTVVDTDAAVQTTHILAGATVEDSLYTQPADAQAEATRRQTLRGTMRSAYRVTVSLAEYAAVDLGAVGTLTHPRFGLSGGVLVRVLGVEPDARNRSVTLTLWR